MKLTTFSWLFPNFWDYIVFSRTFPGQEITVSKLQAASWRRVLPRGVEACLTTWRGGVSYHVAWRRVLPHGVHVGGRQPGAADRRAVVRPHDPLRQQEVTEQAGDQKVLAEQLLEQI